MTGPAFPELMSNVTVTGVGAEKIVALESRMRQFVAEGDSMGIATLMMLLEQGAFALDDPVAKFIPEFEGLKVVKSYDLEGNVELEPLERQPTIRELMSHTAGFAYGLSGADPSNVQFRKKGVLASPDLQSLVDRVATIPLIHQPASELALD